MRTRRNRRGRDLSVCLDQVGNALDSTVDLTPASDAPAAQVLTNWSALLPGQTVPLIWERTYPDDEVC